MPALVSTTEREQTIRLARMRQRERVLLVSSLVSSDTKYGSSFLSSCVVSAVAVLVAVVGCAGFELGVVEHGAAIEAFEQAGKPERGLEMFDEMVRAGVDRFHREDSP